MSNLTTTQSIYAAFGIGDVPAILELVADDVSWEYWDDNRAQKAGVPSMQARVGRQGVADFFSVAATMQITDIQVLNMMEGGNQVAVTLTIEADVPGGGHYRDEEIHLWTFNEKGRVIALRHYTDTAKHIGAWGL